MHLWFQRLQEVRYRFLRSKTAAEWEIEDLMDKLELDDSTFIVLGSEITYFCGPGHIYYLYREGEDGKMVTRMKDREMKEDEKELLFDIRLEDLPYFQNPIESDLCEQLKGLLREIPFEIHEIEKYRMRKTEGVDSVWQQLYMDECDGASVDTSEKYLCEYIWKQFIKVQTEKSDETV